MSNEHSGQWLIQPQTDGSISIKKETGDDSADLEHITAGISKSLVGTASRANLSQDDLAQITAALMAAGHVPPDVLNNPLLRAVYTPSETEQKEGLRLLRKQANGRRGEWLYDAIMRYKSDMEIEGNWSDPNTWPSAYEPTLRHFRELIAPEENESPKRKIMVNGKPKAIYDIPVGSIEDTDIRRFKAVVSAFPKGFGQGARGEAKDALTAKDALEMTHLARISPANVIKKCDAVKAFLRWAERDGCIPEGERFARILPKKSRNTGEKRKDRGYQPFTENELKKMFESLEYRNCENKTGAQYWIPLIGLYTGARINEIAQLHISDIKLSEEGIRCFHITDTEDSDEYDGELDPVGDFSRNEKSLKTDAAIRFVPIHPKLIEIGLDKYIEHIRAQGAVRLFPGLSYETKSGYGRLPSRHFREFTQRLGIYQERKKVFHSFRSTLVGYLQKKGMDVEHRSRLVGHATNTVNDRHYGNETPLQKIAEDLYKVDFNIKHPNYSVPILDDIA